MINLLPQVPAFKDNSYCVQINLQYRLPVFNYLTITY